MIDHLLTDTVELVRHDVGGVDRYGNPTSVDATPVTLKARVEPYETGGGESHTVEGNSATHRRRMFTRPDVTIGPGDRVTVDNQTWQVDGPPQIHKTPRGRHHVETSLVWVQDGVT